MKKCIVICLILNILYGSKANGQVIIKLSGGFEAGISPVEFAGDKVSLEQKNGFNHFHSGAGISLNIKKHFELGFQYFNSWQNISISDRDILCMSNGDYVKWGAEQTVALNGFEVNTGVCLPFRSNEKISWILKGGYRQGSFLNNNENGFSSNYNNQVYYTSNLSAEGYKSVFFNPGIGFQLAKWLRFDFLAGYNFCMYNIMEGNYSDINTGTTQTVCTSGSGFYTGFAVHCAVYEFKKREPKSERYTPHYNDKNEITKIDDRDVVESHSITIKSKAIEVQLWDYGKEDGDKISLFLNDKIILKKYTLAGKRKKMTLNLKPGLNKLIVYAHNLGKDPPNTASVTITENGSKHVLSLSSDLGECGSISIYYEEPTFK
ncbi:MAG: hypothetical protein U0W24_17815 [Bacteroidales bacterium]